MRLIDEGGRQLGVFPTPEALSIARRRELDLVEVASQANPPVCRLMNYGKYLYERAKRDRKARRAQKAGEIKEVRLGPKTSEHDRAILKRRMETFLKEGCKVRVRVRFRGREMAYTEIGRGILEKLVAEMKDQAAVEMAPQMEGRSMVMILSPIGGR